MDEWSFHYQQDLTDAFPTSTTPRKVQRTTTFRRSDRTTNGPIHRSSERVCGCRDCFSNPATKTVTRVDFDLPSFGKPGYSRKCV